MAIDVENSFEIESDGFAMTNPSTGERTLYITSGNGDPSGFDAPVNTWYFRVDTNTMYYKFGALITDWRQVRSQDITFDPANLPNLDGTELTVFDAISKLGVNTFDRTYYRQFFKDNVESSITSNSWVNKSQVTTPTIPAGIYEFNYCADITNNKANSRCAGRFLWRQDGVTAFAEVKNIFTAPAIDGAYSSFSGKNEITMTTDGTITIQVQFGQTLGNNNTASMKGVHWSIHKVRELP